MEKKDVKGSDELVENISLKNKDPQKEDIDLDKDTSLKDQSSNLSISDKKIMWVEDDRFLSDLISRKLSMVGSKVFYATTGEEALKTIDEQKPDLILLDILLPGMSGIEVLEKVKSKPETKNIPVIMLSNYSLDEDIKRSKELGAVKYLVKATVTLDDIVSEIKKVLTA